MLCILSIKGATEGKQPTLLSTEVCHDTLLQQLMELNHIYEHSYGITYGLLEYVQWNQVVNLWTGVSVGRFISIVPS